MGSANNQRGPVPSVFHVNGQTMSIQDCERMSDQELYRLLKENLPAVAETVRTVNEANRETVIAFLRFLSNTAR
jgi:hypothetical protein